MCAERLGLQFVDTVWEHKDVDLNIMRYAGKSRIWVQYHNKTENIKQSLTLKRIFEEHNACLDFYPIMETVRSSKMLVSTYHTISYHIMEDHNTKHLNGFKYFSQHYLTCWMSSLPTVLLANM
jgi:hypothetical protein